MVSIIVPNYNHCEYLEDRILSILNQTYQDFEVIILDDNSLDLSREIIETHRGHSKVSHIVYNKKNSGSPFGLWQRAFELAEGEYIWIAESDDLSEIDFLATLLPNFENEDVVITHSKSYNIDNLGNKSNVNIWWDSFNTDFWNEDFIANGNDVLSNFGKYKCPVVNVSSAIFKKNVLKKIEIPKDFKYCGDWWFWAQIFNKGKVAYCSKPMNLMRKHVDSATGKNQSDLYMLFKENLIVAKNINRLLNENFVYSTNYYWLIDFWMTEYKKSNLILKIKYLYFNVPFSFIKLFYKRLIMGK